MCVYITWVLSRVILFETSLKFGFKCNSIDLYPLYFEWIMFQNSDATLITSTAQKMEGSPNIKVRWIELFQL